MIKINVYILLKENLNVNFKYNKIIDIFKSNKDVINYIRKNKINNDKFVYYIEKRKLRIK